MKIIVDGNLIDTEFIYKISDVYAGEYHSTVSEFKGKCTFAYNHITITYTFRIDFLNKKHLDITLHKFYDDKKSGSVDMKWYENERKIIYDKVENLKEKVVKKWLKNQTTIPKLEF